MHYTYCPRCGTKLVPRHAGDDGDVPYCEPCKKFWFDGFASCVIVMIYNECDEIILCRQYYMSTQYATLTSGYMSPGENAEEAARREVQEELGLTLGELTYGGTHWFPKGDMLMHAFLAFHPKCELHPSEEVDEVWWSHYKDVPDAIFPDKPGNASWALYRQYLKQREE